MNGLICKEFQICEISYYDVIDIKLINLFRYFRDAEQMKPLVLWCLQLSDGGVYL